MRLIPRTLVVLALAGAHIQIAFGQVSVKAPPSAPTDATLTKTSTPSPTGQLSVPTPTPVGGMAYAFDGKYLFILGGTAAGSKPSSQFFTLDLGVPWLVDKPAWNSLAPPQGLATILAGGLSLDNQFLVTALDSNRGFNVFVYDARSPAPWTSQFQGIENIGAAGPLIASDSTVVYLAQNFTNNNSGELHRLTSPNKPGFVEDSGPIALGFAPSAISRSIATNDLLMTYDQNGTLAVGVLPLGSIASTPPPPPTPFQVNGTPPQGRAGHCFVPNANGLVYYVVGGTMDSGAVSDEVWSLDLTSKIWTPLKPLPQKRTRMACAVKDTTLVIWGGSPDPSSGDTIDSKPLLLDVATNNSLTALPSPSPIAPTVIGTPTPNNGGGINEKAKESSNMGAIIGGVVGGLAVVALVAGLFVFRRRKARNMKSSVQVLPRGAPPPPSLSGKNSGGQVNVPMNEYTTISSPFVADDSTSYRGSPGAPPLYGAPALQTVSAPLLNQDQNQNQSKNGSLLSQPVQSYSMPFQAPPIPARPLSGSPMAPTIQSPFEVETEASAHQPLLPLSGSIGANGLLPATTVGGAFSPSMDAASVDLIPFEASEDGDHDHSRSNSIVSSRAGALAQSGSLSGPVRGKSGSQGHNLGQGVSHSQGQGDGKAELDVEEVGCRRDSTETLEYLEIS